MIRAVWKYPLRRVSRQVVEMPQGAQILDVQQQGAQLCLWALVRPDYSLLHKRNILIVDTGAEIATRSHLTHLATFQETPGGYVSHVFEEL